MAINPIQPNVEMKTYRDAKTPIKTNNLVHPLPAEGHLVHDSLLSIPKFWLKDIAYDMKAVKDGFAGTAKDHQTGRLNDVGLKLGGIGIATYLASRTTDPKMRIMEYLGLGAFLTSMSLYPMIAINAPSRMVQGYDIGKEYIDDQGRKKSVYQDGNYIPMDLYRGEYVGENLEIMGDRMGIPRDIKNRNELIKEQARKTAIQNNTLWMLGAGFATPVMTALICCGLEKVISPVMEAVRNKKFNSKIKNLLKDTTDMPLDINQISSNSLSKKVEKFLTNYKDKELPKEKFDKLVKMLSDETDDNLTQGIKEDLEKVLHSDKNAFKIENTLTDEIKTVIRETATGRNPATINAVFNPSKADIDLALKKAGSDGQYITEEQLAIFKNELKNIFNTKIEAQSGNKNALYMEENNIVESIINSIKKKPSSYVSENTLKDITELAKVLGDFKNKNAALDKCKSFKVEHTPETVLARSYKKFEDAIFEALKIEYKDLRQMKESEQFTKEILEKKIEALVNNKEKYSKTLDKLVKIMSDTEIALHGEFKNDSYLKDLITAYENNYNNTAKRINNLGNGKFAKTINKLVKEDVNTLSNSVSSRYDLFQIIDGVKEPVLRSEDWSIPEDKRFKDFAKIHSNGVGSSKEMKITRLIDRIQGVKNSQYRIIHALDVYKREIPKGEYEKALNQTIKDVLLGASAADHAQKLHTINNPQYYWDIINKGWANGIQNETKKSMEAFDTDKKGDILKRFEDYLEKIRSSIGRNEGDFTKPDHKILGKLDEVLSRKYAPSSISNLKNFNLVAQNPIDFFKKASKIRFENQKWLRTASAIGGVVLAGTVLAQFCFGKIKNPHNIQKQVNDDKNI